MSTTNAIWGEIIDVPLLWTRADIHGVQRLTDSELRRLFGWCEENECSLPPASAVYDEMAERGLVDAEGREIEANRG